MKPNKLYLVWQENDQFFNQYDTLEDAVSDNGDNTEVYIADIRKLGVFNRQVSVVKVKKKKGKK